MWEAESHKWPEFAPVGSARNVPMALDELSRATTNEAAMNAYWQIDNVVIVQGALREAAVPTAACLISMLASAHAIPRAHMLELLEQFVHGESALSQIGLYQALMKEIERGFGIFVDLLENGSVQEREFCVDLVAYCALYNSELRPRVRWYLSKLAQEESLAKHIVRAVEDWLADAELHVDGSA